MSTPRGLGAFVMALNPDAFSGAATFRSVISRYLGAIRQSEVAADQEVMAPGDREWKEAENRRRIGLKLDETTLDSLGAFAREHGIDTLQTVSAQA
jgi:LDH2 family malate/lactate/ureidoglycolate dehydrogenase